MPHSLYADGIEPSEIIVCKAKVTDIIYKNGKKHFNFSKELSIELSLFSIKEKDEDGIEFDVSYATFRTNHFCYYCLGVKTFEKDRVNDRTKIFMPEVKPRNLGKTREFKITYVFIEFFAPKRKKVFII